MGARNYRELVIWQLSAELRREIVALSATGRLANDRVFCDQLVRAVSSVPANIAEGYGRFGAADFGRYLKIARGSLDETENHLRDAAERGYIDPHVAGRLVLLAARCRTATMRMQGYLAKAAKSELNRPDRQPGDPDARGRRSE